MKNLQLKLLLFLGTALVAEGCLPPPAPPTDPPPPPPPTYKPTHVSGLFQKRHIMEKAEFEPFHNPLTYGQLTSSEITTLENWRKVKAGENFGWKDDEYTLNALISKDSLTLLADSQCELVSEEKLSCTSPNVKGILVNYGRTQPIISAFNAPLRFECRPKSGSYITSQWTIDNLIWVDVPIPDNSEPAFDYSSCQIPEYAFDSYCHDITNTPECNYDGGACCGEKVDKSYCIACECKETCSLNRSNSSNRIDTCFEHDGGLWSRNIQTTTNDVFNGGSFEGRRCKTSGKAKDKCGIENYIFKKMDEFAFYCCDTYWKNWLNNPCNTAILAYHIYLTGALTTLQSITNYLETELNRQLANFDPSNQIFDARTRAKMCNCHIPGQTVLTGNINWNVMCTKQIQAKGVHPSKEDVVASQKGVFMSWPSIKGRPLAYDHAKAGPGNNGFTEFHKGISIHAEEKLWPHINGGVSVLQQAKIYSHIYLLSTYATDTSRNKDTPQFGFRVPSCTEDCMAFTDVYLSNLNYPLKVGFKKWYNREFCTDLDTFKTFFLFINPIQRWQKIKNLLEFTKFECDGDDTYQDEKCTSLKTKEVGLLPEKC